MKKGVLYQYHIEIENWKEKGSILILFNRANIAAFYQVYQNDLDAIFKELKKLQREFMVFEKDKIKVDNKMQAIFLPGKSQESFEEAYMNLMGQLVPVKNLSKKGLRKLSHND